METLHTYDQVATPLPKIRVIKNAKLQHSKFAFRSLKYFEYDGISSNIDSGAWAFYIPEQRLKILHARQGKQTCLRNSAKRFICPNSVEFQENMRARESGTKIGSYFVQDWERALSKSVSRRVAETWIAARRLANAGLGPQVSDIVVVRELHTPYSQAPSVTAGYVQKNAWELPAGPNADVSAMLNAGVKPDQIRSCVRQQVNGYIIDLNSVVGVEPVNAEAEIEALATYIQAG
jgi:hypothetical protein